MAELNDAVHELIEALCAEGDTFAKKAKYPAALKVCCRDQQLSRPLRCNRLLGVRVPLAP